MSADDLTRESGPAMGSDATSRAGDVDGEQLRTDFQARIDELGGPYGHTTKFSERNVRLAMRLVDRSGIVDKIEEWIEEDRLEEVGEGVTRNTGGRKKKLGIRAVLVAMAALVLNHEPLLAENIAKTLRCRFPERIARELGVPKYEPKDGRTPQQIAQDKHAYYECTRRTIRSLVKPMDPELGHQHHRLMTTEEYAECLANDDPERVARAYERLDWIVNQMVRTSVLELPPEVMKHWGGSVCIDATAVELSCRYRKPKDTFDPEKPTFVPIEPRGGLYVRSYDTAPGPDGKKRPSSVRKSFWGLEATLLVMAPDDPVDSPLLPLMVVNMAIEKPGVDPAGVSNRCVTHFLAHGYQPRWYCGDRNYFPHLKPEEFQIPMSQMGFMLIGDYRDDQLGQKTQYMGMIQVEGSWYCPSMPANLVNATIDVRSGKITEERYHELIAQRASYLCRVKERFADGRIAWACPAAGGSPTARCALKPESEGEKHYGNTRIQVTPKVPNKICTNKASVTMDGEHGAKYDQQHLRFGTPEWEKQFAEMRNRVESDNAMVKDPARSHLEEAGRRRMRGYAVQSLFIAFMVMATNIDQIRSFLGKVVQHEDGTYERFVTSGSRNGPSRSSGRKRFAAAAKAAAEAAKDEAASTVPSSAEPAET